MIISCCDTTDVDAADDAWHETEKAKVFEPLLLLSRHRPDLRLEMGSMEAEGFDEQEIMYALRNVLGDRLNN